MFIFRLIVVFKRTFNLIFEKRISYLKKTFFLFSIFYFLFPIDFLPDTIPLLGWIDDFYLLILGLYVLISDLDGDVIIKHWDSDKKYYEDVNFLKNLLFFYFPLKGFKEMEGR